MLHAIYENYFVFAERREGKNLEIFYAIAVHEGEMESSLKE